MISEKEIRDALENHTQVLNDVVDMMMNMNKQLLDLHLSLSKRVRELGDKIHE